MSYFRRDEMRDMSNGADIHHREEDNVIRAIKEKAAMITGGDRSEPVYLKNVSVIDGTSSPQGDSIVCTVNSIFCDSRGVLCADLVGETNPFNTGIMFGQSIEDLALDDLKNILDALNDENWSVILNNGIEGRKRGRRGFQRLMKKDKSA